MNLLLNTCLGRVAPRMTVSGLALALALGASSAAQATDWQTVSGAMDTGTSSHRLAPQSAAPALRDGEPVHVVISLKLSHRDELAGLIDAQRHAGSPAYGQAMTAENFRSRFAPSQDMADAVADYLRSQGFVNVEVAANRLLVSADGSAGGASRAFHTALARSATTLERINTLPIQLPSRLAAGVNAVLGLQTRHRLHTLLVPAEQTRLEPQASGGAHGFAPTDFPALYGASQTPDARNTIVGVVTAGDLAQTLDDMTTAQRYYGMPSIPRAVVQVGSAGSDTSGTGEWDLDSQNIQGMAGGRLGGMIFFNTTNLSNDNITAAYNAAVEDGRAKIVNVSLGECESYAYQDGSARADDDIFMAANAQGMMFSVSSGDSGSHECDVNGTLTRDNARQSYPASSPYVIAVGGTSLYDNGNGGYGGEAAWVGGGGGPSTLEYRPAYQDGIVPSQGRGVPDIALDADPNTGSIVIVNGRRQQIGGTSLASPLFVGLYARIESATGNAHDFPVPSFYNVVPSTPGLFHDITQGDNGGNNPYRAARGWDYTTGFGSPIVDPLYGYVRNHASF